MIFKVIKMMNHGHFPSSGYYKLSIGYKDSVKHMRFVDHEEFGVGVFMSDVFYPIEDIKVMEAGEEMGLKAIKNSKIAEAFYKNEILLEIEDYFIIIDQGDINV